MPTGDTLEYSSTVKSARKGPRKSLTKRPGVRHLARSSLKMKRIHDKMIDSASGLRTIQENTIKSQRSLSKKRPSLVVRSPRTHRLSIFTEKKLSKPAQWPLSPTQVLKSAGERLSEYEKTEILKYSEVYYLGNMSWKARNPSNPNCGFDDEEGGYLFYRGDHIAYQYSIVELLGCGTFGTVCKAYDYKTKEHVAVKVIRNSRVFQQQAQTEIRTLKCLRQNDTRSTVIRMLDHFLFRGHACIVFELLDSSLYDSLQLRSFKGFSLDHIAQVAKQVLRGLVYIRKHSIVHCDLKPENILYNGMNSVKVIDFGSACNSHEVIYTYIQSRYYRAPEVILGRKYSFPIDMWSFGCILYELRVGSPLFAGESQTDQLRHFTELLGEPPSTFTEKSREVVKDAAVGVVPGSRCLRKLLGEESETFADLIERCLSWDPKARLTPKEALKHAFFNYF